MAFEKIAFAMKTWKDKVSGNTPITAAELNRIEKGISDTVKGVNDLGDSVSLCATIDGKTIEKINFQVCTTGKTNYFQAVIYLPGEEPLAVNLHIWES